MALRAKKKLGFVDGTLVKPSSDADPKDVASWERSNDLVSSWLLHSVAPDIRNNILYASTAHEIWKDLRIRFCHSSAPNIFQLKRAILHLKQEGPFDEIGDWSG
ncbi:uncharacterized protein LOC113359912 [Papaver somniferum]|uniref:uncharacterized protein LOC113359912 n=1 Tax=Papaver somniferum TaxID=3469 RepID=UPI000E704561|nr:uncharacterized protein LOC113359912 [Papaver somniferum]